jgi:FkbM family methyltransferase
MLRKVSDTAPPPQAGSKRVQSRLLLQYQRLALSWHAMRYGRGRAVMLRRDGDLVRVHDGARQILIPHARRAAAFRDGITTHLEAVAEKYVGTTGFTPREGDVIVDVGAGIGEFTLWCADAGARVVAFEPDPLAFACLERNTASLRSVDIFPYALWKENARLRLHGSIDTTQSSLIEDGKSNARDADVEAWSLDQVQPIIRLPVIDFMKVDGEGVEPEILAGAVRTLRRTRVLAVDVGASDRRPNLRARVEAILDSLNFRWLPHDDRESILALNTSMVGPFSSRVLGRHGS